jgi:hypothetical protein
MPQSTHATKGAKIVKMNPLPKSLHDEIESYKRNFIFQITGSG